MPNPSNESVDLLFALLVTMLVSAASIGILVAIDLWTHRKEGEYDWGEGER